VVGPHAKLINYRLMTDLELLHQYLELDPAVPSGLRWKKAASNSVAIGQEAGSRDPRGYYRLQLRGRSYKCHRLVLLLNGVFPLAGHTQVDHIDRNRSNNLLSNLRWATPSLNVRNCEVTGQVPYRYVRRRKSGRFEAQYMHPSTRQKTYVGVYDDAATAHKAALVHRLEHHWI
jgi:hypothetical protein